MCVTNEMICKISNLIIMTLKCAKRIFFKYMKKTTTREVFIPWTESHCVKQILGLGT